MGLPRVLCLDVGDRRIGLALSDGLGITAQPLETYHRVGYGPDVAYLGQLIQRQGVDMFLLGLPLNMDGSQGGQVQKVKDFAQQLVKLGLPIHYWDERMTTQTAERTLIAAGVRRQDRKQVVDKVAAAVILQAFLDAGGLKSPSHEPLAIWGNEDKNMADNMNLDDELLEEDSGLVELVDEDGQTVQFEHLMTVEHEGDHYVVLTEVSEDEQSEEAEVLILKIEQDDQGEDCYVTVEDDEVQQAVFDKFVAAYEEDDGESQLPEEV